MFDFKRILNKGTTLIMMVPFLLQEVFNQFSTEFVWNWKLYHY